MDGTKVEHYEAVCNNPSYENKDGTIISWHIYKKQKNTAQKQVISNVQ